MGNNRTFVHLFKHNPEPSKGSDSSSIPLDDQINLYMTDYMTRTKRDVISIKQITYLQPHMSLNNKALVVFERFKSFDDKDLGMSPQFSNNEEL